jgi:hypothetical protein
LSQKELESQSLEIKVNELKENNMQRVNEKERQSELVKSLEDEVDRLYDEIRYLQDMQEVGKD